MNAAEFDDAVKVAQIKHPKWFALEADPPASSESIGEAEKRLGIRFPDEYRDFLGKYGGGYFAFGNVFSVTQGSEWNVEARNQEFGVSRSSAERYLAFSDPGTGDYYGFRVIGGETGREIWVYDHDARTWHRTSFSDLFEFLTKVALTS